MLITFSTSGFAGTVILEATGKDTEDNVWISYIGRTLWNLFKVEKDWSFKFQLW